MTSGAPDLASRQRAALSVLVSGLTTEHEFELARWLLALPGSAPTQQFDGDAEAVESFARLHRVRSLAAARLPDLGFDRLAPLSEAMAIQRHLLRAHGALTSADVEVLVLKGLATAQLDHEVPGFRESGDVDLLVRPGEVAKAWRALVDAGYSHKVTHPFRRPRFFHSETFIHADGTEVDVHHRLAQPGFAPVSCWGSPDTFSLGGQTFRAMSRDWRFVHAVLHQMMNPPPSFRGLNGMLDCVALWRAGVDLASARAAASEVGQSELLERGTARLRTVLLDDTPAIRVDTTRIERRHAAALDGNAPVPGHTAFAAGVAAQPLRYRPAYLRDLVWPSKAYRHLLDVRLGPQIRHVVSEAIGR